MRVLIYDDHSFVTEAISNYFTQNTEATVLDRIHTITEAILSLKDRDVDVLISDVLSDEDAGFTLFEHVRKFYPNTKIIAYSSITNVFIIQTLLEIGVSAVVNKKESIATLWETTQKVWNEHKTVSKNVQPLSKLTNREKEIVAYLAKGLSAKEIADILGLSPNTVNNQKNALLEKFDCLNSTELVVKLSQFGLISVL